MDYNIEDYYDGSDQRPKGAFRISPSGIHDFFDKKTQWYRENLLGEPKKFTGSSATLLGTVMHFVAEMVAESKIQAVPYDSDKLHSAVESYIDKFRGNEDYDINMVETNWKNMGESLVKEYVLNTNIVATEVYKQHELLPGIYLAGTMDAIVSSVPTDTYEDIKKGTHVGRITLRDWKSSSTKPSSFSYGYRLQAMSYCYLLAQQGIKVDEMELCFAVRPTKTLPVRTFNFKLPFNDQAYNFIEGILHLIAESVQCFKDYEDMQFLLACDYRLKKNDIPRPE